MNYIKEINAFYDSLEHEPLSSSAVALWHTLIHINNKTRWMTSFTASGTILQYKSGLASSSFKRARTELTERGYITCESRGRNKAPLYHMVPLAHDNITQDPTPAHQMNQTIDQQTDQQADHQTVPLIKQDKTKPNETNHNQQPDPKDAIRFYIDNFGNVSPFVSESILHWTRDVPEDLIIHAMERALEQGKPHWGYVKAILTTWSNKGIRTIDAAKKDRITFQTKRNTTRNHTRLVPHLRNNQHTQTSTATTQHPRRSHHPKRNPSPPRLLQNGTEGQSPRPSLRHINARPVHTKPPSKQPRDMGTVPLSRTI